MGQLRTRTRSAKWEHGEDPRDVQMRDRAGLGRAMDGGEGGPGLRIVYGNLRLFLFGRVAPDFRPF